MMLKKRLTIFITAVVALPVLLFALVSWYENRYEALPVLSEEGHIISPFHLRDQRGREVTIQDWKDKIVVANFFFTHCPVICPKMMDNLKIIHQAFKNDSTILINSFTVDPERDSVTQLAKYIRLTTLPETNWQLITGNKMEIYRLARKDLLLIATDGDGGPSDFIHSDRLVLMDRQKKIRGYYEGTNEADMTRLIADIKKLKHED